MPWRRWLLLLYVIDAFITYAFLWRPGLAKLATKAYALALRWQNLAMGAEALGTTCMCICQCLIMFDMNIMNDCEVLWREYVTLMIVKW